MTSRPLGPAVLAFLVAGSGCARPDPAPTADAPAPETRPSDPGRRGPDLGAVLDPRRRVLDALAEAKKDLARLNCQTIEKACQAYYLLYGDYPTTLDQLLDPPAVDGVRRPPYLEGGAKALTDPWGGRYQFRIVPRPDGGERPYVSTTAPDGTVVQNFDPPAK